MSVQLGRGIQKSTAVLSVRVYFFTISLLALTLLLIKLATIVTALHYSVIPELTGVIEASAICLLVIYRIVQTSYTTNLKVYLSRLTYMDKVGPWFSKKFGIRNVALKAGLTWTPLETSINISFAIAVSIITVTLLVVLNAATDMIIGLKLIPANLLPFLTILALIVPPIILRIWLEIKALERAKGAEDELPYIILWAWLFERMGLNGVREALREASRSKLFKYIAASSESDTTLLTNHPSNKLRRFYSYYTAIAESGGDTTAFLEDSIRSEIDSLKSRIAAYAENGLALGTGILGVLSTMLVFNVLAVILSPSAIGLTVSLLPLIAVLGYVNASMLQPRLKSLTATISLRCYLLSVTAGLTAFTLLLTTVGYRPLVLPIFVATPILSVIGACYMVETVRIRKEEATVIPLLRLVIEYSKSMSDKPIEYLLELALKDVRADYLRFPFKVGTSNLHFRLKSWLARYTLYTIINIVGKHGATDPYALEMLYDLVYTYSSSMRFAALRMRVLGALALGFPPVVVASIAQLSKLGSANLIGVLSLSISLDTLLLATLASSIVMGITVAKLTSFTIRNTLWPLASMLTTTTTMILLGLL